MVAEVEEVADCQVGTVRCVGHFRFVDLSILVMNERWIVRVRDEVDMLILANLGPRHV